MSYSDRSAQCCFKSNTGCFRQYRNPCQEVSGKNRWYDHRIYWLLTGLLLLGHFHTVNQSVIGCFTCQSYGLLGSLPFKAPMVSRLSAVSLNVWLCETISQSTNQSKTTTYQITNKLTNQSVINLSVYQSTQ